MSVVYDPFTVQDEPVPTGGGQGLLGPTIPPIQPLKIFSANVRGINDDERRGHFLRFIKTFQPLLLFLQETKLKENSTKLSWNWKGSCFLNSKESASAGVASLSYSPLTINLLYGEEGRLIITSILYHDYNILFVNLYALNDERNRKDFFSRVHQLIAQFILPNQILIIVGDFNCTLSEQDNIHRKPPNALSGSINKRLRFS